MSRNLWKVAGFSALALVSLVLAVLWQDYETAVAAVLALGSAVAGGLAYESWMDHLRQRRDRLNLQRREALVRAMRGEI